MKTLKHILILDPVAFAGGSKISTQHLFSLLDLTQVRVSVLTSDLQSWKETPFHLHPLCMPKPLEKAEQGVLFFIRHFFIAAQLLWLRLFIGRIDTALGGSGPGVDFALYLVKIFLNFQLIQMIHGPVAPSRTLGRCLSSSSKVFYLESSKASLSKALKAAGLTSDIARYTHFQSFRNGLPEKNWPTPCQYQYCVVFWAASLLKWKGLDTLTHALSRLRPSERPETHISYIRPKQNNLPISEAPQSLSKVFWYQEPSYFDALRSHANVFVSTSTLEPFGLSILEAMAAGMCVILPEDGAYWDTQLEAGVHCLKYPAGDEKALAKTLLHIQKNIKEIKRLGKRAKQIAKEYRCETCFSAVYEALLLEPSKNQTPLENKKVQG